LLCAVVGAGCSPLVRFGDIQPPRDRKTLVEVVVVPVDRAYPPADLLQATSNGGFAELLLDPVPKVSSSEVASEMASNVQSVDSSAAKSTVDAAKIATDARRVASMYAARGYFRAHTVDRQIVDRGNDTMSLHFAVEEGPPTKIVQVVFAGITPSPTDKEMNKRLDDLSKRLVGDVLVSVGDVWTEALYLRSLDIVQREFRELGFIHATVTGDNWVSREKNEAAVWFNIEHGPLVRAQGEPQVEGARNISVQRIKDRVPIKDGDILEANLLRETEQQVYDLGPFFSVQARPVRTSSSLQPSEKEGGVPEPVDREVQPGEQPPPLRDAPDPGQPPPLPTAPPRPAPQDNTEKPASESDDPLPPKPVPEGTERDSHGVVMAPQTVTGTGSGTAGQDSIIDSGEAPDDLPDMVPVQIQIQEAALWDLTIGPAATADSQKLELSLPVAFTHRNLFGEIVALRASAKPALVFPDAFGGDGTSKQEFGFVGKLGLDVPSFFEEFLRFTIEVGYERDPTQETKKEELTGRVGWSRRLGYGVTAHVGYNVSQVRYFGGNAFDGIDDATTIDRLDLRFASSDFVTWLSAALVFDRRDGIYDAKRGVYATATFDYGDQWTGSDVQFMRTSLETRGYITLDLIPWFTIAMRAKVGFDIFPQGQGTPESVRFKSGGPTSHRGFSSNHMGDYVCGEGEGADKINRDDCGGSATDRIYVGGNYVFESNLELRFQPGSVGFVAFMDVGRLWSRYQDEPSRPVRGGRSGAAPHHARRTDPLRPRAPARQAPRSRLPLLARPGLLSDEGPQDDRQGAVVDVGEPHRDRLDRVRAAADRARSWLGEGHRGRGAERHLRRHHRGRTHRRLPAVRRRARGCGLQGSRRQRGAVGRGADRGLPPARSAEVEDPPLEHPRARAGREHLRRAAPHDARARVHAEGARSFERAIALGRAARGHRSAARHGDRGGARRGLLARRAEARSRVRYRSERPELARGAAERGAHRRLRSRAGDGRRAAGGELPGRARRRHAARRSARRERRTTRAQRQREHRPADDERPGRSHRDARRSGRAPARGARHAHGPRGRHRRLGSRHAERR